MSQNTHWWPAGVADRRGDASLRGAVMNAPTDEKRIATLSAKFALAGHAVHRLLDGGFLVCKFGHTRHATNLAELQAFAVRVGVLGAREVDHG